MFTKSLEEARRAFPSNNKSAQVNKGIGVVVVAEALRSINKIFDGIDGARDIVGLLRVGMTEILRSDTQDEYGLKLEPIWSL